MFQKILISKAYFGVFCNLYIIGKAFINLRIDTQNATQVDLELRFKPDDQIQYLKQS